MKINQKIIAISLIAVFALIGFSCRQQNAELQNADTQAKTENVQVGSAQSPTEAYIMLYNAVKSQNTDAVKQMMSQKSQGFAEMISKQQNKPVGEVLKNGFTATTFAENLPQVRDERVKENMGALEVYNQKEQRWEDLPFILENGGWKLAVGDAFAGTHKPPGKGQSQIEAEAANKMGNNLIPYTNANINPTANTKVIVPKRKQNTNAQ